MADEMEHMDAEADAAQIDASLAPIVQAIQLLAEKIDGIEQNVAKLNTVVLEELIGGIEALYKRNKRDMGIKAFSEKHGKLFDSVKDGFAALYPEDNLIEKVYDLLEGAKGQDAEWNDEKELDAVKRLSGGIMERLQKVRKMPDAVAVEVEVSPEDDLRNYVKGLKKKRPDIG